MLLLHDQLQCTPPTPLLRAYLSPLHSIEIAPTCTRHPCAHSSLQPHQIL